MNTELTDKIKSLIVTLNQLKRDHPPEHIITEVNSLQRTLEQEVDSKAVELEEVYSISEYDINTDPKSVKISQGDKTETVRLPLNIECSLEDESVRCVTADGFEVWYFNEQEAAHTGVIAKHIKKAYEDPEETVRDWKDHILSDIDYQENA